jgi:hypothetical protein
MWCLTCFFVSACGHSPWLQALFPHLQHRFGHAQPEDRRLFCLAAREFYRALASAEQRERFKQALSDAANAADPFCPYADLLKCL